MFFFFNHITYKFGLQIWIDTLWLWILRGHLLVFQPSGMAQPSFPAVLFFVQVYFSFSLHRESWSPAYADWSLSPVPMPCKAIKVKESSRFPGFYRNSPSEGELWSWITDLSSCFRFILSSADFFLWCQPGDKFKLLENYCFNWEDHSGCLIHSTIRNETSSSKLSLRWR